MSTSLIHFLTFAGQAALELESSCESLLSRRVEAEPNSYGSDDWSSADHLEIQSFCRLLLSSSSTFPTLYFSSFLDTSSVGGEELFLIQAPDKMRVVYGSDFSFAFYPSQHLDIYQSQIRQKKSTELYRQGEARWYLNHLDHALKYPLWLNADFLVVSISRRLGPSWSDEEIRAALLAQ